MTKNIATLDRAARLIVGLTLIALTLAGQIGPWGWLGLVGVATALINFCPLYAALGIGRKSKKSD